MDFKLASSGALCAALLLGCSSAPKLTLPSGQWENINVPPASPASGFSSFSQAPAAAPVAQPVPVATPAPVVAAVAPPKAAPPVAIAPVQASLTTNAARADKPAIITASAPPAPPTAVVPPKTVSKPAPALKPAQVAATTQVPTVAPTKVFAAPPAKPVVTVVAPVSPPIKLAPIIKPLEQWQISPGDATLRKALSKWAARAGWQLVWEASVDVPINVNATFEGDFRTAVKRLFQSLSAADVNLSGMLYAGNKVLRVTESGRRAQ